MMTWKRGLLWELKWSAVEASCIGVGLLLNQFTEQGLWFLWSFLCVDLVVRLRHYCDPLTYSRA
jgi:hypothetical protein